jgi:hypothetical protein
MLIPEQTMLMIDVTTLDVTDSRESGVKPKLHTNGAELHKEDLILCKTDLTDIEWYLTEINKIYSDEVEIIFFTTPTKVVESYIEQSMEQRYENLNPTDIIEWYLAEISKIYSDEVEIIFFTTPIKVLENYIEQWMKQRSEISEVHVSGKRDL